MVTGVGHHRNTQANRTRLRRPQTSPAGAEVGPSRGTAEVELSADVDSGASLANRARNGMQWSALFRIFIQVLQFGTTAVLARLIAPHEFGLVALLYVFAGFASIFTDLGLGAAVIHQRHGDQRFLSTAFWLNAISGLAVTALLIALSPAIASFFHSPRLISLIIIVSFTYSLSMSIVHSALLQQQLRFRTVGLIELTGALIYTTAAIGLAFADRSAVALVSASLIQTAATTLLFWRAAGWRPTSFLSKAAVQEIWRYSSGIIGYNTLNYWARNIDNLVLGRVSGATSLAFYARAYNVMLLPIGQMNIVVSRVLFPTLSLIRDDRERLKRAYTRVLSLVAVITFPASIIFVTASPAFVSVVYGERWSSVAPLLALLAASGPAQFIGITCGPLYQALGATGALFRRSAASAALTLLAVIIGIRWGAEGVAAALVIKFYLSLPITTSGVWPLIRMSFRDAATAVRSPAAGLVTMSLASLAVRWAASGWTPLLVLFGQVVAGLVAYFATIRLLQKDLAFDLVKLLPGRSGTRT